MKRLFQNRIVFLFAGALLGLIVGLNVQGLWPSTPLHAVATQGEDNFAIATGFVDEETEGIFFLDFLTGDLAASVINPRAVQRGSGGLMAHFRYNILKDFDLQNEKGKNPKFLMVTGSAGFFRGSGRLQPAESVIYIASATTGQVCCYGLAWNPTAHTQGQPQQGSFTLLDKAQFRQVLVRE